MKCFKATGLVVNRRTNEITAKINIWMISDVPKNTEIADTKAPPANQMVVSPRVMISIIIQTIKITDQIIN